MSTTDQNADAALLAEIKQFRDDAQAHWQDIYDQGRADKEFVTLDGAQWDSKALAKRKAEGKPSLEFNLLRTYCRQQINTQRQNRAQAMVLPVDSNADVDTAKVLQGLIKDTEEASDFENVADTAAENAVYGGLGFYRCVTDYVAEDSFQQEPKFVPIYNPEAVLIDPLSKALDGSDMRRALVAEWVDKASIEAQYGDDAASDFDMPDSSNWCNITDKTVCIVEYFYKDEVADTLCLLEDGSTAYKSELDADTVIVKERPTTKTVIKWAKASGAKILERGEFPGKHVPIIPVYGEVTWVGNERHVHSLVHFAKDPQRLFNYWKSVEAHILQKNQDDVLAVEAESIAGFEDEWQNPAKYGMSRYRSRDPNDATKQFTAPQRIGAANPPVGVLNAAQGAQSIITDILNMHAPVMGGQGNETSGVAINMRQRQSETAQFHFQDNLNKSIRHSARILLDVYQVVYDTEVVRRIVGGDGEVEFKKLNALPANEQEAQKVSRNGLLNDLSIGRYDVRMDTGPSYNTQRDQNFAMMMQLMQFNPQLFQIIGDILLKDSPLMNAKEIAERVKLTIPEQIRNAGKEGGQQLPPEVQQQMQQLDQVIQKMSADLAAAQQQLHDKQADRDTEMSKAQLQYEKDIAVAQIAAASRSDVQELRGLVELLKQHIDLMQAPPGWSQQGEGVNNYAPSQQIPQSDLGQPIPQQEFIPQPGDVPPDPAQIPMNNPATEQGFFMGNDLSPDQAQPQPIALEPDQLGNTAHPLINEDLQP